MSIRARKIQQKLKKYWEHPTSFADYYRENNALSLCKKFNQSISVIELFLNRIKNTGGYTNLLETFYVIQIQDREFSKNPIYHEVRKSLAVKIDAESWTSSIVDKENILSAQFCQKVFQYFAGQ